MAQTVINVGSNANDGTGDDLRSAMISINSNFSELYAASPVTSNIQIEGNEISSSSNADIEFNPGGTGSLVFPAITINDNNITGTRSNEDINISASGTGHIVVGALRINGTTVSSDDSSSINFAESNITLGSINIAGNVITSNDSTVISFGGHKLSGVSTPSAATDVATKEYVDGSNNNFGNLEIVSNKLANVVTNNDLQLDTVGTGLIAIQSSAKIMSGSTTIASSAESTIDSFTAATYRSAKYLISITNATNGRYETSEVYIVHDGTTPFIQSTGVSSSGVPMCTFTADINSGSVRLRVVPQSADSTVYKYYAELIVV